MSKLKMFGIRGFITAACVMATFFSNAQKDLVISGGNTVSSFVCENKTAFVWGSNAGGQLGLSPNPGAVVSTPTAVTVYSGVASPPDIKQINSGSGSHFVALACAGDVWAWGVNGSGQVGNNTSGGVVTIPTRVIANTAVAAANRGAGNVLQNAAVVYAGTVNSFAILQDGKLVSWGSNSGGAAGQLGNGTTTDQSTANYVLTASGTPLTGVTQIFAGDNVAYALVDPDGDGIGTVYSWGNGLNGTLGRDAAGTTNPSSSGTVQDSYARPVYYANGTQMNNITQLQAGDVFGIALDVNGYVWTWGNGGWNNSTGNTTVNYTGSDPRRVIAGFTTGASNDGTYLLAKAIGGGQGYGMAVTIDGKPVAWGGGGCGDGGATGNGTVTGSKTGPQYIQRTGGIIDNNVTLINRGDLWGFYGTANNDFYAWGCNSVGQLGIGNTTDQPYATLITPPSGCSFRDPLPFADLKQPNLSVCASTFTSLALNSGFTPPSTNASSYTVTWSKATTPTGTTYTTLQTGPASTASNLTYTATTTGKFKVTVHYSGSNSGCVTYADAKDSVTITPYVQNYTIPSPLTFCGTNINPYVNGLGNYNWYKAATGGSSLATTQKNNKATIPVASLAAPSGTTYTVYVQETGQYVGNFAKKTPTNCGSVSQSDNYNNTNNVFTTSISSIVMDTAYMYILNDGNTYSNIQVVIYGTKVNNGHVISDNTQILFTSAGQSITLPAANGNYSLLKIPLGYTLGAAGNYAIGPKGNSINGIKFANLGCGSAGITDDIATGGPYLTGTGSEVNGNWSNTWGEIANMVFHTPMGFCDRVPVTLTQSCPCTKPTSVVITTPATTPFGICQGTAQTLTGSATVTAASINGGFTYSWRKILPTPVTVPVAPTAVTIPANTATAMPSYTGITGAIADAGTYVLRVEDGNTGNSACYTEGTVVINVNPTPTITGTLTVCIGSTTTLTGSGTAATTSPWTSATTSVATVSNTGVVTGVSAGTSVITYKDNNGCTQTATVTVNALPTITGTLNVCAGLTTTLTGSATPATTNTWTSATTSVATVSGTNSTSGVVTGVAGGTSVITYTNSNGCKQTATVTVNPLPTVTGTLNVCIGSTTTLTGSATPATTNTWTSATTSVATVSGTNSTSGVVTGVSAGTSVITYTNSNGCVITATVTVNPTPTITGTLNVCIGSTTTLTGSGTAATTSPWTSATTSVATVSNTGVVTGVSAGTSVITYKDNNGCTQTATVTVNALPTITGTLNVCAGLTTTLTGSATPATTGTWSSATTSVATVSGTNSTSGVVTGVAGGTSVITYTNSNGCKQTATVTVNPLPTVTGTLNVCIGSTTTLTGSATPATTNTWTSATTSVATVSGTNSTSGVVTGVSAGTSVITYTNSNGCVITATVTVNPTPTITGTLTVCIGSTTTLVGSGTAATTSPWTSATTSVATVSNTGVVTGVSGGTSVITYKDNNGCTQTATVTVNTTAAAGVTIATTPGATICTGTNVSFQATGSNGGTGATYAWTSSQTGATVISTADNYSSSGLVNGEVISVKMTSSLGCAVPNTATASVTMTVNPKVTPTISITSDKTTICPGQSVNFSIQSQTNQGTTPAPTYQWRKNGGNIAGATNVTYSPASISDQDVFDLVMTTGLTCVTSTTATATGITITVTPVPTISVTITADKTSICANNPVNYTATVTGSGATPAPTYEWFITSSGTAGSGTSQGAASTTATTFGTSALTATNNKVYVQVVSNAACAATTAVASNVVAVTVNAGITAGSIGSDQTICYNGTVAALTELTTSTAVTPGYVWEAGPATSGPWTAIPGATNANYTPPAVGVTTDVYIHRVVTDASAPSACASATSNIVHITVLPQLVAGTISANETTCSGAATTAMTSTAATGGTGSFTYQWQSNTSSATGTYTNIAGATNATYPAGSLTTTTYYQLVYTSGSCGSVTTTTPVTKTVTANTTPTVSINDPGQTCDGTGMTFTATTGTAGTTPTYQWYLGGNPVGTNSNTYAYTAAVGDNGKSVTVKVTSSDLCNTGPVTSAPVVLNIVGATTPTVAITTPTTAICVGMPVTFKATGTGTGGSPTYQWYESSAANPAGAPVGTNSPTYTSTTLTSSTDQVWVSMTSSLACIAVGASNPVLSNKVSITVKPIPTPAIVQATGEICSSEGGFTFTSSGTASGSNLQWQLNTKNISGATGSSYYASQAGDYTLVEDNGSCTVTSNPSTLYVVQSPVAYAGADLYVTEGTFVQLQAGGGTTGTTYSWTPTTGLSSSTVSNPSFKAENTTTYTVTLTNVGGATGTKVCTDQSSVTVVVVKPIVVPNVITVNGDGSNDTWKIQNIEGFPNATFEIFNRWGNLVWKSTGYPKQWDGTNFRNGEVLPDGTYFYIIDLHSPIFTDPYTGYIQIIK